MVEQQPSCVAFIEAATRRARAISQSRRNTQCPSDSGRGDTAPHLAPSAAERQGIAAVVDNAETVTDTDRAKAARLKSSRAHQGLFHHRDSPWIAAVRGSLGSHRRLVEASVPAPARDAFLSIAGASFAANPDFCHFSTPSTVPRRSICLVAAQAADCHRSKACVESSDDAHADVEARVEEERLAAVFASLALSLNSDGMNRSFGWRTWHCSASLPARSAGSGRCFAC